MNRSGDLCQYANSVHKRRTLRTVGVRFLNALLQALISIQLRVASGQSVALTRPRDMNYVSYFLRKCSRRRHFSFCASLIANKRQIRNITIYHECPKDNYFKVPQSEFMLDAHSLASTLVNDVRVGFGRPLLCVL